MAQPIQLDRNQSDSELLSDLAVILGPDPDLPPGEYAVGMLEILGFISRWAADETEHWVRNAVKHGVTWQQIGDALVISRQAAHKRFS